MTREVTIITTGGTIDKVYGKGLGVRDMHIGEPVVYGILANMNFGMPIEFSRYGICAKDSLDMTDDDRSRVIHACREAHTPSILITHGSDSMIETAFAIEKVLGDRATIVLTGALIPACVTGSDASLNISFALGVSLFAPRGIYIAMNGVHKWNQCKKNPTTGIFEPI